MSQHQNVQEQAQIELDRVVGQSRTPKFADMAQLPYVRAIVKEVHSSSDDVPALYWMRSNRSWDGSLRFH